MLYLSSAAVIPNIGIETHPKFLQPRGKNGYSSHRKPKSSSSDTELWSSYKEMVKARAKKEAKNPSGINRVIDTGFDIYDKYLGRISEKTKSSSSRNRGYKDY